MQLRTLADVRTLIGHLPAEIRSRSTWQVVIKALDEAARGADTVDVAVALRMVLMQGRVECRVG